MSNNSYICLALAIIYFFTGCVAIPAGKNWKKGTYDTRKRIVDSDIEKTFFSVIRLGFCIVVIFLFHKPIIIKMFKIKVTGFIVDIDSKLPYSLNWKSP